MQCYSTLIISNYYLNAIQRLLFDIKKVPLKRQLKWNKSERADKNKPSTHSLCNDSVTFLSARDKRFCRFACKKSCNEEVLCMNVASKKTGRCVFVAYITLKNGKRIYARQYGKKAFCFYVD